MITHELTQGSKEWHELRTKHFTASEAPAMLGLSKYKGRADLLREKATGISKEVDAATKLRFDEGHASEAATRAWAEAHIGEELYPATGTLEVEGLPLLASFDGINMMETVSWENKLWNEGFAEQVTAGIVPDTHWPQLEQQLLVSGAEYVLFTVSNGHLVAHTEYKSQPERRARLIAGWKQFAADLANYQHVEIAEKPKAEAILNLPALSVQATGMVTYSNLPEFKAAAENYIANINTDLQTDQQFADAEATVKFCKATEDTLEVTKKAILAQTATIDEVIRTVDHIQAQLRDKRLMLDKMVKSEKEARKIALVRSAGDAYSAHVVGLQAEIGGAQFMPLLPRQDFGSVIKGLKSISSMQDALDTSLANAKIEADAIALNVRTKLAWCNAYAVGMSFLFPDLQQIISKPMDDFTLTITSRIEAHKKAEEECIRAHQEAALNAERTRIQAEEEAKARSKVEAEDRERIAFEAAKAEAPAKPDNVVVIERQDSISAFLASRDFGKDEGKVRAIIVEYVKFEAQFSIRVGAGAIANSQPKKGNYAKLAD